MQVSLGLFFLSQNTAVTGYRFIDSLLYDSPLPYTGYLVKNAIPGKVNQLNKQSLIFLDRMLDVLIENQTAEAQN